MIQFILGTAGTGKTSFLLEKIKQTALNQKNCVLLVPEQFSQTAEINLYELLGDRLSSYVFVYSFRSYCEKIQRECGGVSQKTISDAGRILLVRRAVEKISDELNFYKKTAKSIHFCSICAETIKELKIAGAKAIDLIDLQGKTEKETQKFAELGLIFSAYEAMLADTGLEATDRIFLATEKISDNYFADIHFFIDNFDGFTAPEYALLEKICAYSPECTITLCTNSVFDTQNGIGLFSSVQKTATRLLNIAKKHSVTIKKEILLEKNYRAKTSELTFVDRFLRGEEPTIVASEQTVKITATKDIYAEMQTVTAQIRQLALDGIPYHKIAVLCRDIETYADCAEQYFDMYAIPYFCDKKTTAEFTAVAVLIKTAFNILAEGLTTKNILALLKTRLTIYNTQTIAEIENYAFVWQLTAQDWQTPFVNNPAGFAEAFTASQTKTLHTVETVRGQLIAQLNLFRQRAKGGEIDTVLKEVYLLLTTLKSDEVLLQNYNQLLANGDCETAEQQIKMWDKTMQILSELGDMLCNDTVTPKQLCELFTLLLRATEIGHPPRTKNQVLFGEADRTRLEQVEYLFIIGLNEGVFPAQVGFSGLLTHIDRELLVQNGIEMPGAFENRILLEDMFLYRAFTSTEKILYLSYPVFSGGAAIPPCSVVSALQTAGNFTPICLEPAVWASTEKAAADMLSDNFYSGTSLPHTLYIALLDTEKYAEVLEKMLLAGDTSQFCVSDTTSLKTLIGTQLKLSPTRVESFYTCRFAYFLKYVLKITQRQKAQVNVMQAGTFVHYILEKTLKSTGEGFAGMSKNDIDADVQRYADEFLQTQLKGVQITQRLTALIKRLCKNCVQLLLFIQAEQQQSQFKPMDFELKILDNEDIKPIVLKTQTGQTIKVIGNVDRVDVYKSPTGESYIRVVDYKTGDKKFKLQEIYNGLNMQMLLYLFSIIQNGTTRYPNPQVAGALYLLADPAPDTKDRTQTDIKPIYSVDGLVIQDDDIIKKMDSDYTGVFVPIKYTKSGYAATSIKNNLADLEKLSKIQKRVEDLVVQMATELSEGVIQAVPLKKDSRTPCEYCDYITVCRHQNGQNEACLQQIDSNFNPTENDADNESGVDN